MDKIIKILCIGNSFSQDATRYLHKAAESAGISLKAVNLYVGGCSLEMHYNFLTADAAEYEHEVNGMPFDKKCSLKEALGEDCWDIITIQQASGDSGIWESYNPYLEKVLEAVKMAAPSAELYFHRTWAYDKNNNHPHFPRYNGQLGMYEKLVECSSRACETFNLKLIPVGNVIQALRETDTFNTDKGGMSVCRDAFHLSLNYGRYAAAATWLYTFTGKLPDESFIELDLPSDSKILKLIRDTVKSVCDNITKA